MPLTMAKAGETVTIQKITGKDEVRLHLAELGFVVGETITVVNEISGNLILQVKEARIALDKTLAMRASWCLKIRKSRPRKRGLDLPIEEESYMKTLKDVKVGETATVKRLHGEGPVKRRIMDMGLTKGVQGLRPQGRTSGRPHGADRPQLRAERS